jgi:hypothetical protein
MPARRSRIGPLIDRVSQNATAPATMIARTAHHRTRCDESDPRGFGVRVVRRAVNGALGHLEENRHG